MKFLLCLLLASRAFVAEKPAAQADATPQPATLQAPAQTGPAQKDAEQQPVATVTKVTGEVLVRHAQAWGRVTEVPLELLSGDTVSTDRGRAEVHFLRDDSTLVLDVGTHLTIADTEGGQPATRCVASRFSWVMFGFKCSAASTVRLNWQRLPRWADCAAHKAWCT